MNKISVVIITKNEEKNIEKCLKNLVDFADEIIVLDSKSSDKTLENIRKFNYEKIKIHDIEWQGFAKTKNLGVDLAENDWILSIDADEIVTQNLKTEILKIMQNPKNDGYFIPRLLYFCGKPVRFGGAYPDFQLRLFNRKNGRFRDVLVHESVEITGSKAYLKNRLLHFSYVSIFDYFERFNRYTELDAQKKFDQGKEFTFSKIFVLNIEIFKRLFLKFGFLDGFPGIFYHIFSSFSSLVKYAKLWEIQNRKK